MNYTTLQADAANYSHRTDLTAIMPTLIANAEAMLFRELTGLEFEVSEPGTVTGNAIALPTLFDSVSRLVVNDRTLDYSDGRADDLATVTTTPTFYTIENGQIFIMPPVDDGADYVLLYHARLEPLSSTVTTNWLLDNAPDLYLWATVSEVGRYTSDLALVSMANGMAGQLLDAVKAAGLRKKFPARGGLQIRPRR